MVSNGEIFFQKTQKYKKHAKKSEELLQNWACMLAPQSASRHSKSADWHPARPMPVYPILCFPTIHESVLTHFSLQKKKFVQ